MSPPVFEANFDGIVGPTHNYSGLSLDNFACTQNKSATSNPKQAALQGLEKMKLLADLGLKQAVLPPHPRPFFPFLKKAGFIGSNAQILKKAYAEKPLLLSAATSAAAMWTANAATVTPSTDSADHKLHITPANLHSEIHRSIEAKHTEFLLRTIFHDKNHFTVHPPLASTPEFADEGAANHTRLCPSHKDPGLHLFVYGKSSHKKNPQPKKFIPRQTLEAFQAIALHHKIQKEYCIFAQQNPKAIDAGVFHNDVISLGNEHTFFYHEEAFLNTPKVIETLKNAFQTRYKADLSLIKVPIGLISLKEAVSTYLFNSQLVTIDSFQNQSFIFPSECLKNPIIQKYITNHLSSNDLHYSDIQQSMRNGGGPACLRLRIPLNQNQINALPPGIWLTDQNYPILQSWVEKHYRDELHPHDLADPILAEESTAALKDLGNILGLGPIHEFHE